MNCRFSHFTCRQTAAAIAAASVALGALSCGRASSSVPPSNSSPPAVGAAPAPAPASRIIEVRISDDLRARAGIETATPVRGTVSGQLRLPGVVAPDAYTPVTIPALVGGRVLSMSVEIGATVTAGGTIATIDSPEIADAQAAYLSHRADLEADHQRVMRLERLVTIGAASKEDLEEAIASHAGHTSEVARAAARLELLGLSPSDVEQHVGAESFPSMYVVRAPAAGVITKRSVNPGQIVAADTMLAEVTGLDPVWVEASAYEQDLARLRVGLAARVFERGSAATPMSSRTVYIDPQLDPSTRTAQIRLELPNPGHTLRFGMLMDVEIELPGMSGGLLAPSEAVQSVGDAEVVYVEDPGHADVFREQPVHVGTRSGAQVEILDGLTPTDRIVVHGAFFVRAERLRTIPAAARRATGSGLEK